MEKGGEDENKLFGCFLPYVARSPLKKYGRAFHKATVPQAKGMSDGLIFNGYGA